MEWVQRFYLAEIATSTVQLSPLTTSTTGCTLAISLPAYLSASQLTITSPRDAPPTNFYPTSACAEYEVRVRRIR